MAPTVHILATVRKPELLEAALLVFRTLRVGFPTAPVMVWGNALPEYAARAVAQAAQAVGAGFRNVQATQHDAWIESLLAANHEPFFIADTDLVFFEPVEAFSAPVLAGRLEPEWCDPWTRTRRRERLHTCLMYVNPAALRMALRSWMAQIPEPWGPLAQFPLVRQTFLPVRGGMTVCQDTFAGVWQAGIGTAFTAEQNAAFEHLNCATYADCVGTALGMDLALAHRAIYADPSLARGIQRTQTLFYARHAPPAPASGRPDPRAKKRRAA